ncbi:MAG: hypothetical protein V1647_03085, partial [Pseudomonadota bacterium]
AYNDACKTAVRTVLINMYGEDVVKQNEWQLIKVYKDARSFVMGSQIISEKQNTDVDNYSVKLELNVDSSALRESIVEKGISLSGEKILTILPLIVERNSADGNGQYWWGKDEKGLAPKKSFSDIERALARYLSQGNFTLVDPYSNQLSSSIPESYKYMELKTSELTQLGKLFITGLVASGYVWSVCPKNETPNKNTCETTLSIKIISADTGKIVAAKRANEKATAPDTDEAKTVSRAKACKTVSDSLLYQLARKWDKNTATNFKIVIKGVKDFGSYTRIKQALGGVTGLNNVVDRYQGRGLLIFEGDKRGASAGLSDTILSKCFPDGGASIASQSESLVEIKVL